MRANSPARFAHRRDFSSFSQVKATGPLDEAQAVDRQDLLQAAGQRTSSHWQLLQSAVQVSSDDITSRYHCCQPMTRQNTCYFCTQAQVYCTLPCDLRICDRCDHLSDRCPVCESKQRASYPLCMIEIRGTCLPASSLLPAATPACIATW